MIYSYAIVSALLLISDLATATASLRGSDTTDRRPATTTALRTLQESVDAIYLLKDTETGNTAGEFNADANHRQLQGKSSERTDNIQLPDGTIYEVKNAQAGWAANLVSGTDSVHIPPGAVISSDGTIDMKGQKPTTVPGNGKGLFGRNLQEDSADTSSGRKLQSGTRTVLAVRVILNDGSYNFASQSGLSNDVFGNGVDPYNLKSHYASCSYNQLTFNKASDRSMTSIPNDGTTAISSGVVDIKVDLNVAAGDSTVRNAVTAKLNSVFGVSSPDQLANHVMYCLPSGVMQGIAYAYVNSWNSVYTNDWCNYLSTQMHEVRYNILCDFILFQH